MKKKEKLILAIVIIGVLAYASSEGLLKFDGLMAAGFTPVFCSDYTSICCEEVQDFRQIIDMYDHHPYICPDSKTKCVLYSVSGDPPWGVNYPIYKASARSYCQWYWNGYHCDGETQIGWVSQIYGVKLYSQTTLQPGEKVYTQQKVHANLDYSEYHKRLVTSDGIEVSSNNCRFNTQEYESEDHPGEDTVPIGQCWRVISGRHICGYLEEQCSFDSDCIAGHTLVYQGKGAECNYPYLETYGCRKYNETKGDIWQAGTRCEVINTIKVQCCPASGSCGPNAVCDPVTFTCKPSNVVECTFDWECGSQTLCDRVSKTLKKGVCENNKCVQKSIQSVECCYDSDCPTGEICNANKQCERSIPGLQDCTFACCENELNFYDKPCPEGQMCCGDHTCAPISVGCGENVCDNDGTCEPNQGENKENCPADCKYSCDPGQYYDIEQQKCLQVKPFPWDWLIMAVVVVAGMLFMLKMFGPKRGRRKR